MVSDACAVEPTLISIPAHTGMNSEVTHHAQLVAEVCELELAKIETDLEQLEAEINPALDDNALVAFSYVLGKAVDTMKKVPDVSIPVPRGVPHPT